MSVASTRPVAPTLTQSQEAIDPPPPPTSRHDQPSSMPRCSMWRIADRVFRVRNDGSKRASSKLRLRRRSRATRTSNQSFPYSTLGVNQRAVVNVFGSCLEFVLRVLKAPMSLMEKEMYYFGPFSLDPSERVLSHDGTPLTLTPKVFDTLLCLVRNPGRVLTKDELLKEIWPDTFVEEVNLAVNISTLRKALGESPQDGRYILTVPGRGYRFVAEVREVAGEDEKQESPFAESHSEPQIIFEEFRPNGVGAERYRHGSEMRADMQRPESESGSGRETNGKSGVGASLASVVKGGALKLATLATLALMLAATTGGYFWFEQKRRNAPAVITASIAVLPFADLSPGKDQGYLSDGLAEELINELAKVPGLKVVARSSAFQFKGQN